MAQSILYVSQVCLFHFASASYLSCRVVLTIRLNPAMSIGCILLMTLVPVSSHNTSHVIRPLILAFPRKRKASSLSQSSRHPLHAFAIASHPKSILQTTGNTYIPLIHAHAPPSPRVVVQAIRDPARLTRECEPAHGNSSHVWGGGRHGSGRISV